MILKRIIPLALAILLVVAWTAAAEACPGCAEAQAGQGANRANIVRGYFWSIVFMMSMPFMLVGGFGTYCYLHFRKVRKSQATAQAPTESRAQARESEPSSSRSPALTTFP